MYLFAILFMNNASICFFVLVVCNQHCAVTCQWLVFEAPIQGFVKFLHCCNITELNVPSRELLLLSAELWHLAHADNIAHDSSVFDIMLQFN